MNINFTLIIEIGSFLILVYILRKILFGPVAKVLEERQLRIEKSLKEAENKQKEAEKHLKEIEERFAQLDEEIVNIKEKALKDAQAIKEKIINDAKKEAQFLIEDSKEKIAIEIEQAKRKILDQLSDYVIALTKKLLLRELKPEDHCKFLSREIEKITRR